MDQKLPWIILSSSFEHVCKDVNQINNEGINPKHSQERISGTIEWFTKEGEQRKTPIANVLINPKASYNSISLPLLTVKGFQVICDKDGCHIYRQGKLILDSEMENNKYVIRKKEIARIQENVTEEGTLTFIKSEPQEEKDIKEMTIEEQKAWKQAMHVEMDNMIKSEVLEEAEPPPQTKIIGSRWTFKVKYNESNEVSKIRARLVAKGCSQREGIDFAETYAPVVNQNSIRILLTLVGNLDLEIRHCDIASAFLYGEINETIYMRGPKLKNLDTNTTYRLKRAIYGLKQAAHSWNIKIDHSLKKMGYNNSILEPCLYQQKSDLDCVFILIHVDDLLIASNREYRTNDIIQQLRKEYKIKDLGEAKNYLGIQLDRDHDKKTCYIHQSILINQLLEMNQIKDSKPTFTPMTSDFLKSQGGSYSTLLPNNIKYQQTVGSLLYIGLISRPDVHLAVNLLARKCSSPTQYDWECVKRVMKYLNTTIKYRMKLGGKTKLEIVSYCDADWGGDTISRKSTSGHLHFLGESLIGWRTTKQSGVALSTAEAEFIAASTAVQTIVWIQELLESMSMPSTTPIKLHSDNQSAIKMLECEQTTKRTKHIDIRYHHVKDFISRGIIGMVYCPTEIMTADVLTKPLPRDSFEKHVKAMGLTNRP